MRRMLALAAFAAACVGAPDVSLAKRRTFNERVLALAAAYQPAGYGGYAWPAVAGASGTTRDLRVGKDVIAHGGLGNHCVGVTLEVFWRALSACPGGVAGAFDAERARAFKHEWYVPELGGSGAAAALTASGLGAPVALEDARPGDFVQAWTSDEAQGHSMIFLAWIRDDAGSITGIRYWSSQPWTDGIGTSETDVRAATDAFDPSRIHIARADCPD